MMYPAFSEPSLFSAPPSPGAAIQERRYDGIDAGDLPRARRPDERRRARAEASGKSLDEVKEEATSVRSAERPADPGDIAALAVVPA
jgi:hypothetical protein